MCWMVASAPVPRGGCGRSAASTGCRQVAALATGVLSCAGVGTCSGSVFPPVVFPPVVFPPVVFPPIRGMIPFATTMAKPTSLPAGRLPAHPGRTGKFKKPCEGSRLPAGRLPAHPGRASLKPTQVVARMAGGSALPALRGGPH